MPGVGIGFSKRPRLQLEGLDQNRKPFLTKPEPGATQFLILHDPTGPGWNPFDDKTVYPNPLPSHGKHLEQELNPRPERRKVISMPMTLDQIVEETKQLAADVVAELVDRILLTRHGGVEPEFEAAWKTEIDRRVAEIEAGK